MNIIDRIVKTITGNDKADNVKESVSSGREYGTEDGRQARLCFSCDTPFGVNARRHHCKCCGRAFCVSCTFRTLPPAVGDLDRTCLRVCDFCEWMDLLLCCSARLYVIRHSILVSLYIRGFLLTKSSRLHLLQVITLGTEAPPLPPPAPELLWTRKSGHFHNQGVGFLVVWLGWRLVVSTVCV